MNFTYVNGYMIVGPSRALVERSVRWQEAGYTLLRSTRFTDGLPADGNANFSALFYHNLAPLVQPFAERIASSTNSLPQEQQQAIKAMAADMPPTLAYAYAQGDSITSAANTEGGPFGFSPATLLGMPRALEIQHILHEAWAKIEMVWSWCGPCTLACIRCSSVNVDGHNKVNAPESQRQRPTTQDQDQRRRANELIPLPCSWLLDCQQFCDFLCY